MPFFLRVLLHHACLGILAASMVCATPKQGAAQNPIQRQSSPNVSSKEAKRAFLDTLEKSAIQIGSKKIMVYIVKTGQARARGLMFVRHLPKNEGMLFVFPTPRQVNFWLKDTWIPLDIAYFDQKGYLRQSLTMQPDNGRKVFRSQGKVLYVVETNAGWLKKNKIQPGTKINFFQKIRGVTN